MALKYAPIILAVVAAGCGGSSREDSSGDPARPTGGGGAIADYVGTYTGTYSTVPADGTSTTIGTLAIVVAADGAVTGTRHDDTTGADQALSGTIDSQGRLSLTRPGASTTGFLPLFGHLAKESGSRAITTLVESQGSEGDGRDAWYAYRLSGGPTTVGKAPLTTGKWLATYGSPKTTLQGAWYGATAADSGAVRLTVKPSGQVSGSWTERNGTVESVSGALYDLADAQAPECFGGTLKVGTRSFDIRLIAPSGGTSAGLVRLVGTASEGGDDGEYALYLGFR